MIAESTNDAPVFTLLVSEKGGDARRIVFRSNELTVGRVQGNGLVLPKGNVSKRHARILYREGRFIVTDLNSTNGTYVNRQRIAQATIVRDEDSIFIGDFVIRVEVGGEDSGSEPVTPRREFDAPIPLMGSEVDASTSAYTGPSWERISIPDDVSTRSSGPPARLTEPPTPEAHQRSVDSAASHRRAIAQLVARLIEKCGAPSLEPTEAYQVEVKNRAVQFVDQLLVDGLIAVDASVELVLEQALDELLGTGPLEELLADLSVSKIAIARYDEVFEIRDGRQQVAPPGFSSAASLERAIERLCLRSGAARGEETSLERTLRDGSRLFALLGDVTPEGPLLVIEKPRKMSSSLDDLVRRGTISRAMATFLSQCVQARLNLLVVGPRDEGAHVVLSALASAARERILTASSFDEFSTGGETTVRLDLSRGHGELSKLFEVASAMPQARLLVTLSDRDIQMAALEAMGSGLSGVFASFQASNLSRALLRLPADLAAARSSVSLEVAIGWVRSSFDIAIEVTRLRDGRIRVLRIAELELDERGALEASDIFRFNVSTRVAAGGAVEGSFAPSGQLPKILGQLQAQGMRLETSLFSRPPSK